MIVTYKEPTGKVWTASEFTRIGIGARAAGDPSPEATHLTIQFESGDEQRFASNVPDDWHTPRVLAELFAEAEAR